MNHATVKPARVRSHSDELHTDVLRTIGFTAACSCGWQGDFRRTYIVARMDSGLHASTCPKRTRPA